ncbi:hypothetical protein [Pseudonocardia sp. MH-G8]|uniref:hypothetical protein n=1 Tax=Pseudonocardia sp. MH-G8 TaxID=1854588 RepID=UPI000BA0374E|nr:hypothetical protein [Pseudonocardia sp. MH-G8]OZM83912.1 hypothetical protein CFP66_05610 [Pseudonocardia sp. MH-G8]
MPSSMIFASLVVLWLLILVPAVARRRQEVARPSVAALSGRVLERPLQHRRPATGREREVHGMDEVTRDTSRDHDDDLDRAEEERDDRRWERPTPRYRPGRGGFDPEAAALAARARYAFRQRVVLAMLIVAVITGVIAAIALPGMWWPHAAVDLALVGYLVYLRRQVRMEESIRERRAARMAGTRRTPAADDPELDTWARRGRDVTRLEDDEYADELDDEYDEEDLEHDDADADEDLLDEEPERIPGTGEPLRRAKGRAEPEDDPTDGEPALPRLRPAPPPALPAGTALVEADDDDPDLYELDGPARPDYRRAAGE